MGVVQVAGTRHGTASLMIRVAVSPRSLSPHRQPGHPYEDVTPGRLFGNPGWPGGRADAYPLSLLARSYFLVNVSIWHSREICSSLAGMTAFEESKLQPSSVSTIGIPLRCMHLTFSCHCCL